jgi:endoribonuclease Dicer
VLNSFLLQQTIADVAEAVIGAAYVSGGRETALRAVKALGLPVPQIDRWLDFSRKVLAPPPNVTAKLRTGTIEAVEAIIGHKLQHPHLLAQALVSQISLNEHLDDLLLIRQTHESIQGFESTTYERLEFIGDAILDFSQSDSTNYLFSVSHI